MLVSFVSICTKLTSVFQQYAGNFLKKNLNKNNNDDVRPIIPAFLSFYLLFPYALRTALQKIPPPPLSSNHFSREN